MQILDKHKKTFPKAIITAIIVTIVAYSIGVIFVDFLGIKYFIVGILAMPITFF